MGLGQIYNPKEINLKQKCLFTIIIILKLIE